MSRDQYPSSPVRPIQEVRDALSMVEDVARKIRGEFGVNSPEGTLAMLVTRLAQIVREEIVQ